jgi:hypothetical protein
MVVRLCAFPKENPRAFNREGREVGAEVAKESCKESDPDFLCALGEFLRVLCG